jgi:hypothetical protein
MQLLVSLEDAGRASELLERLWAVFSAEAVSFDPERSEVRIEPRINSDRALVQALATIEGWLAEGGHGPTRIQVDGRRYLLTPPAAVGGD